MKVKIKSPIKYKGKIYGIGKILDLPEGIIKQIPHAVEEVRAQTQEERQGKQEQRKAK
jgi:polysaccharide pyruvyl transferase WcaK-like protein